MASSSQICGKASAGAYIPVNSGSPDQRASIQIAVLVIRPGAGKNNQVGIIKHGTCCRFFG